MRAFAVHSYCTMQVASVCGRGAFSVHDLGYYHELQSLQLCNICACSHGREGGGRNHDLISKSHVCISRAGETDREILLLIRSAKFGFDTPEWAVR